MAHIKGKKKKKKKERILVFGLCILEVYWLLEEMSQWIRCWTTDQKVVKGPLLGT